MRTYPLFLSLAGLLLGPLLSNGQRLPRRYAIQIRAQNGVNGSDFRIYITRTPRVISLRYGRLDSIQTAQLHADPRYAAYVAAVLPGSHSAAAHLAALTRFSALVEQYKVYRWNSLRLGPTPARPFRHLLDSLYATSAAQLERRAENRNRYVLDGTSVSVRVTTDAQLIKALSVYAPRPASHPLLYRLLHESLQLYRQAHPTSFLDLRYTRGY